MELPVTFVIRAVQVARRILLRGFPSDAALSVSPTMVPQGQGYVALFRYGIVVFVNVPSLEQQHLIDAALASYLEERIDDGEEEQIDVSITSSQEERVLGDRITLRDASVPRLQVLVEVLARSVLLASYETRIKRSFELIEPLVEKLARNRHPRGGGHLLRTIGSALVTEHDMVGRAELTEKPDLLWEHSELEGFYLMLEDEFELRERERALVRKIDLISRTAQTSLGLLHARRSLRVEWYIAILIIVEIALTLFELFFRHP